MPYAARSQLYGLRPSSQQCGGRGRPRSILEDEFLFRGRIRAGLRRRVGGKKTRGGGQSRESFRLQSKFNQVSNPRIAHAELSSSFGTLSARRHARQGAWSTWSCCAPRAWEMSSSPCCGRSPRSARRIRWRTMRCAWCADRAPGMTHLVAYAPEPTDFFSLFFSVLRRFCS